MKTKITSSLVIMLLILSVSLVTTSCKKKEGCTDSRSINYDPTAEKDNNSCIYKGSVVFWQVTSDNINGITTVTMTDGTSGSINVNKTSIPACNASGCFTYTNVPGTYFYSASDTYDGLTWSGSVTITSDGCQSERLTR